MRAAINNGDNGLAVRNALNGMTSELYKGVSIAHGLYRPLRIATLGSSQVTGQYGLGYALQHALAIYHPGEVEFYHRGVFTSNSDATIIANRGNSYATAAATPTHLTTVQSPQFVTDLQAGLKIDCVITDFAHYNDSAFAQSNLDTLMTTALSLINTWLTNGVQTVIVWGLFGKSPTACQSWANMWRYQEAIGNGRIRFVDCASVLADPTNTSGTTWVWRGGTSALGAATVDSTHVSDQGARYLAPLLANVLRDYAPRVFNWPASYSSAYDPANFRWSDVLKTGGLMIGSNGLDTSSTNSGLVPGTGTSGYANRWSMTVNSGLTATPSITTNALTGEREFNVAFGGTVSAGGFLTLDYNNGVTNMNNSVSTRKYIMGAEIELIGVTGLNHVTMRANASSTWDSPTANAGGEVQHGVATGTSEIWKMRSLYPVAWSGDNKNFTLLFIFRASTAAGSIKVRRAFLTQVEE